MHRLFGTFNEPGNSPIVVAVPNRIKPGNPEIKGVMITRNRITRLAMYL